MLQLEGAAKQRATKLGDMAFAPEAGDDSTPVSPTTAAAKEDRDTMVIDDAAVHAAIELLAPEASRRHGRKRGGKRGGDGNDDDSSGGSSPVSPCAGGAAGRLDYSALVATGAVRTEAARTWMSARLKTAGSNLSQMGAGVTLGVSSFVRAASKASSKAPSGQEAPLGQDEAETRRSAQGS